MITLPVTRRHRGQNIDAVILCGLISSESLLRTECVSIAEGDLIPDCTVKATYRIPVRIVMTYPAVNVVCSNVSLFAAHSYGLWHKDIHCVTVRSLGRRLKMSQRTSSKRGNTVTETMLYLG